MNARTQGLLKAASYFVVLVLVAVVTAVAGCSSGSGTSSRGWGKTKPDFTKVDIGMTKAEVINVLGQPDEIKAQAGVNYIIYLDCVTCGLGGADKYFVRFIDGKVESFGQVGDFDSTKDPTLNLNIKNR